jgi:beta-ureidopropionase / N-carbamoyl-L-amino-acid hydrolase
MRTNLTINAERLWDTLMETARFGALPGGGIKRLAASVEDKHVRDWFRAACSQIGLVVSVDRTGNMFARREGKMAHLPPILMGSHLDTQPTGGKFDGILGVLAALEAVRTLHKAGFETNAPIEIVNWTNEEGSRFSPAMLASGAFAGVFSAEQALATADKDGITLENALQAIDYQGEILAGGRALSAYFELHIEQGPILEAEKKTIGIVTGVQAVRWYDVVFKGQSAHTGATPMTLRQDALLGGAALVLAVHDIAMRHKPMAVASTGTLDVRPSSRNVVPGEVVLSIDMRHQDDAVLDLMEAELKAQTIEIADKYRLESAFSLFWNSPAVRFDPVLIGDVRHAAAKHGLAARDIVSGAGHDAAYIARIAPSTMIFVPCAGGISHNEAESASFSDCAAGAQVLLDAVLACDDRLGSAAG